MRLITEPDPILHQPAQPVRDFGPELARTATDLRSFMHDHKGMGLAAPQVGLSLALLVLEYRSEEESERIPFLALANPQITWSSAQTSVMTEGCLSLPGLEGDVIRPKRIRLKARDLTGCPVKLKATGLLARILQHEIDHLNGILYPERLLPGTALRQVKSSTQAAFSPSTA